MVAYQKSELVSRTRHLKIFLESFRYKPTTAKQCYFKELTDVSGQINSRKLIN